jgi:hypothetical protein
MFTNKIKRVQACTDARGHHFQHLLKVHSNFSNALYFRMYFKHQEVKEKEVKEKLSQKNVLLLVFTPTKIRDNFCTELGMILQQHVPCGMLTLTEYCRSSQLIRRYADISSALRPQDRGLNPAEAVGFFGRKYTQHAFLRRSQVFCIMSQIYST